MASCSDKLLSESDELVGQYPILVYKHWMVPRRYIWNFWAVMSNIDGTLSDENREISHSLSELLIHRLRTLVVSFLNASF